MVSGARREASFPQMRMPPVITSDLPLYNFSLVLPRCGRRDPAIDGLLCAGRITGKHWWPVSDLEGAHAPTLAILLSKISLQGLLQAMQMLQCRFLPVPIAKLVHARMPLHVTT